MFVGFGPCKCGCKTYVRRPFQNGCKECFHIHPKLDAADVSSHSGSGSGKAPHNSSVSTPGSPLNGRSGKKSLTSKSNHQHSNTLPSIGSNMLSRIKGAVNQVRYEAACHPLCYRGSDYGILVR